MQICNSFYNIIPPVFVLLITVWAYYTFVVVFCIDYITNNLTKRVIYLSIFHILLVMYLWSFFATMLQTHAAIPVEYKLLPEEHEKLLTFKEGEINQVLKKLVSLRQLEIHTCTESRSIRYCRTCRQIKPDRAHHCSSCNRCILKMDHHCPWVNNCVGYSNYKQFILMLFYICLLSGFYIATLAEILPMIWEEPFGRFRNSALLAGLLTGIVAFIFLIILFVYHIRLIIVNETTLESMKDVIFIEERYTFNLGCCNNFLCIFGNNCCLWCLPIPSPKENGYEFEVN